MRRSGLTIREISRLTGYHCVTVRKYLEHPEAPSYGPRTRRPRQLDAYEEYIDQRLAGGVWNAVVLLRELKDRGYTGGYTALKDYLQPRREAAKAVAVRRFETAPGHQAQVDWLHMGAREFTDGSREPLSGFVFTLGNSRAMYAGLATDQRLGTFLSLHEAAFAELGGVPREILYDRVKTVVLGTDERGETLWHPVFLDFARYWGFRPRLCAPYRAQTKGKVENGVGYIRKSFLCACRPKNLSDLAQQLHAWVVGVANRRVHGTTHRVVYDAWREEKPHLLPLAGRCAYPYVEQETRKVSRDAYVAYRASRYSAPWALVGQDVQVQERSGSVEIVHKGLKVAVHPVSRSAHQVVTEASHHAGMPYGPEGRSSGKAVVTILLEGLEGPQVEVRPLSFYDLCADSEPLAAGGAR
jgi:transposase